MDDDFKLHMARGRDRAQRQVDAFALALERSGEARALRVRGG